MSAYGHVIKELEDQPNLSAEEAIRQARERVVPVSYLSRPVSSPDPQCPELDSNQRPTP
jgi:hypothetical protein